MAAARASDGHTACGIAVGEGQVFAQTHEATHLAGRAIDLYGTRSIGVGDRARGIAR